MPRHLEFYSFSNKGYEGQVIHVETDIRNGFPGFDIIGLPDKLNTSTFFLKKQRLIRL